ncbi:V-type proton ATPase 116 kDa subunit a isoform like protein [Argiope bruennichi]|uniref:V-type proton ATPase subunit a n=1 Tax=Argiope bruennichi TaxID=94029 RepID=A0A8T0E5J8_ARGBR|nr:V-type proton ATPase 116 kDa subunit a isoform like protein [Argiope bruennichi]
MGSIFRSEEMTLCQLFLQSEAAYACVSELGELGLVQFRDLNPDVNAFQRKFVNEVRRCDEMERKLRFLEKEIKKDGIAMMTFGDNPEAPQPREMIDLEATFEKLENELREVNTNAEALKKTYLELTELKHILRKTQQFFDEMHDPSMQEENVTLLGEEGLRSGGQALKLGFVAGVILRERLPAFERMLWRVCHGNVFLRQADIDTPLEDPITGDQVYKSVFIIFFQGDQLKTRVKKICEGFRATLYPCPETPADRREMSIGVMTRIEDLNTVLGQTQDHRYRVLVAAAKNIKSWFVKVRKIKAIYHTLNLFNLDVTQKCLIAECWCACSDLDKIQMALCRGTELCGGSVPSILHKMQTNEVPPTFNRTNKFSQGFQNIVDAYGVASYREVNPALFTIITFPFLFAVMFGDAGHGLLMTLFALWMVLKEKGLASEKSNNEIWLTFFNGRYIILLMGIFSVYTGIIYNDIFSKSLNLFGSSWYPTENLNYKNLPKLYQLDPNSTDYMGKPYPFGVDPVILLIFSKWSNYKAKDASCAPSLLIMLINMFLFNYPTEPCYLKNMYAGQPVIQGMLVVIALLCIPWMLFAKPYMRYKQWVKRPTLMNDAQAITEDGKVAGDGVIQEGQLPPQTEQEVLDMPDIFINQAIHTIEYCLGSISHTASYLRLWALSLAHAQLSEVLWNMVLRIGLRESGGIVLYLVFAAWAFLTVGVLLVMEGLSAFLHALRCQLSKFYSGTGYMFVPFSFDTILDAAGTED